MAIPALKTVIPEPLAFLLVLAQGIEFKDPDAKSIKPLLSI
jgi:hypothetical protein